MWDTLLPCSSVSFEVCKDTVYFHILLVPTVIGTVTRLIYCKYIRIWVKMNTISMHISESYSVRSCYSNRRKFPNSSTSIMCNSLKLNRFIVTFHVMLLSWYSRVASAKESDADRTYCRCCPVRAWTRLRFLEGARDRRWLWSET